MKWQQKLSLTFNFQFKRKQVLSSKHYYDICNVQAKVIQKILQVLVYQKRIIYIRSSQSTMKNLEFGFEEHFTSEWVCKEQEGATFYTNDITNQKFQLFWIEPGMKPNNDFQIYTQRSAYPLPNTPKIIILKKSGKDKTITLLAQCSNQKPQHLIPTLTLKLQLLQNIRSCSRAAQSLYQKYGNYCLTEQMLGFDLTENVLLWTNKQYQCNQPQFLFQTTHMNKERALILQIIEIYQKYSSFNLRKLLLIPLPHSFAEFRAKISKLIQNQKIKLTIFDETPIKHPKFASRPVSPTKIAEKYHQAQKKITNLIFKSPKKDKIPNFLTQICKKTQNSTNNQSILTKVPQLLRNKEQFLNVSFQQHMYLKSKSSSNIRAGIDKTVKLRGNPAKNHQNGQQLAQTLTLNKIKQNSLLQATKCSQQQSFDGKMKRNIQEQKSLHHKRGKPVSLLDLCEKFTQSQYIEEESNHQIKLIQQSQRISYTFNDNRPVSFQKAQQFSLSFQEYVSQLID